MGSQRQRQVTLGRWHRTRESATPHPPPLTAFEQARGALGAGGGRVGFAGGGLWLSRLRPFVVHIHLGVLLVLLSSYHVRKS